MVPTPIGRRARLARARRLHTETVVGLSGSAREKGSARRILEVITRPLVWIQAAVQEFLRLLDRWSAGRSTVRIPWDAGRRFLVVGHRGSPTKKIENTLESFDHALDVDGANAVEVDLCLTKDGQVVVWHDWDPNGIVAFARQLGAEPGQKYRPWVPPPGDPWRRATPELTLAELRAHYGYALARGRRAVTARIETVEALMAWAATKPTLAALFLDMKVPKGEVHRVAPIVERTRAAVKAARPRCEMVVLSPEPEISAEFRRLAPEWSMSCDLELPAGIVKDPERQSAFERARSLGNDRASLGRPPLTFQGWKIFRGIVERDLTAWAAASPRAAERGYVVWTINHRGEQRQLVEMGVHGMLTDRPRQLRRLVTRLGRPL